MLRPSSLWARMSGRAASRRCAISIRASRTRYRSTLWRIASPNTGSAMTPRPSGTRSAATGVIVVGTSHRTGTAELRDRLFVEETAQPALLSALRAAGVGQALVLSTCDRSEVQAAHGEPAEACERIVEVLARRAQLAPAELSDQVYRLRDRAALRHIFAVASSLDSRVIGEPQVLGQLKASHRIAREAGMIGGDLEAVLQSAYRTAKRVRSETALAEQ